MNPALLFIFFALIASMAFYGWRATRGEYLDTRDLCLSFLSGLVALAFAATFNN